MSVTQMSCHFIKRILVIATMLIAAMPLTAADVDVATAQSAAMTFLCGNTASGRHAAPAAITNVQLIHTEHNSANAEQAVYYIFNTSDSYVIVAGDDRAEQILVWGDSPLDMNIIPENMRYWLNCYKKQIEYLQAHTDMVVDQGTMRRAPSRAMQSVAPLLTALWDQSAPYYYQCPMYNGSYSLTGCAATSLSMICYYWRYPEQTTSTFPSYTTRSLNMTVEALPPTTFDYDNMLDNYKRGYSTEQANAVAHLMRYVGQAEHMDYTPGSSGVYDFDIDRAIDMLGFDSDARMIYKEDYTDEQWAAIIQEELIQGRPLEYCGFGGMSGHAFNVDGYDAERDLYHINWGWSGSANGYCALNAFHGGGTTYRSGQLTFIGLEPPVTTPTIRVRGLNLSVNALAEKSSTTSFKVKGRLLSSGVTLTLNDPDGIFALETSFLSLSQVQSERRVNVTYSPTQSGTNEATVTLSSPGAPDVTVSITGTAVLETYDPVMTQVRNLNNNSVALQWEDYTPTKNVSSYSVEITPVPFHELRLSQAFDQEEYTGSSNTDWSSNIEAITGVDGWTGSKVYRGNGYILLGGSMTKGWIETPAIDMHGNEGLTTVKVTGKCTGADAAAPLKIKCGDKEATVILTNELSQQSVLLECRQSNEASVRLSNSVTGKRCQIMGLEVLAGDDYTPIDLTRAHYFDEITTKHYEVSNLAPGNYSLRVQAVYTDGTLSQWSNNLLTSINWPKGDVNRDNEVNIADINTAIDIILSQTTGMQTNLADVNGDGEVNIADVNAIIDLILSKE